MTVERERVTYATWTKAFAVLQQCSKGYRCGLCAWAFCCIDAASIALDMAVAAASDARRASR